MRAIVLVVLLFGCGEQEAAKKPDGPEIRQATEDRWCTDRGDCYIDGGDCNRADGGTCTRHHDYACLSRVRMTDDKLAGECWSSYGACKRREAAMRANPETKKLNPCVIMRRQP